MASESAFLRFGTATQSYYQHFRENVFGGASNSQVFFLAVAFGFDAGIKAESDFPRSNNGPRTELSESDFALMKVLQLAEFKSSADFDNSQQRYDLAMRYAEAGIRLMWEKLGNLTPAEARQEILIFMQKQASTKAQLKSNF
jgi:hypothetical protein